MNFTLMDLMQRPDIDYSTLKRRTDACAQLGRSYEIDCIMPDFCDPGNATIGFCRIEKRYCLYLRPQIRYHGDSKALAALFSCQMHFFDTFHALSDQFRQWGGEIYKLPSCVPRPPTLFDQLRSLLEQQVLGQSAAVEAAAFRLYSHICKQHPARPLSLIFFGPTGVGKSELGKAITPILQQLQPEKHWQRRDSPLVILVAWS